MAETASSRVIDFPASRRAAQIRLAERLRQEAEDTAMVMLMQSQRLQQSDNPLVARMGEALNCVLLRELSLWAQEGGGHV